MSELHSDDQTAGHPNDRAVIRLRPKSKPQAIRHGFPWVFADEAVLDRRTKALPPGGLAVLEDAERQPLALVTVNPVSKIIARVMDTDPGASIDGAWLRARLTRALQMRERIYDEPFYRLVHAEADGLPGLVIDRFGDAAVIQPNAAWADGMAEDIADALIEVAGVSTVVLNGQGRSRGLEGLAERLEVIRGAAPTGPVQVRMNGATYLADLLGGQKTGLFFDQRPNHAFAQRLVDGGSVLDVFSHGWFRPGGAGGGGRQRALHRRQRAGAGAGTGRCGRDGCRGPAGDAAVGCFRRAGGPGRTGADLRRGGLRPAGLRAVEARAGKGPARL